MKSSALAFVSVPQGLLNLPEVYLVKLSECFTALGILGHLLIDAE